MDSERQRLTTFWWTWSFNKRYELARTGFYAYDEIGNMECNFCKLKMDWWTSNPISQHIIRAPHCKLMNGLQTNNIPIPRNPFKDILIEEEKSEQYDFMDSEDQYPILHTSSLLSLPATITLPHTKFPRKSSIKQHLPYALYPTFSSIWTRLNTYSDWPPGLHQKPKVLSEAGFFYTQFNDRVTCFQCGGSLNKWETDSDPWVQHAFWFPHCHYLYLHKGKTFITQILQACLDISDDDTSSEANSEEQHTAPNNDKLRCKICFVNDIDILLVPCHHCVSCSTCIWSLPTCPICRQSHTSVIKLFF